MQLLLDGVSSFGAEPLDFADDESGGGGGDGQQMPARRAGCLVRDRAPRRPGARSEPHLLPGSAAHRPCPGSAQYAVHPCRACVLRPREALREYAEQGGRTRASARYAALAEQVRAGFAALGIAPVFLPRNPPWCCARIRCRPSLTYATLHDALKARGFVIYAGQGDLAERLFRISTMGAVSAADMDRLLECCGELLR